MQLREYQASAIKAAYGQFKLGKKSALIVLPTGSGKTPVIAKVAQEFAQYGERVLILAHVRELLEQSHRKLIEIEPSLDAGIYSAGMGFRDTDCPILVAGIQSVWNKSPEIGARDLVIIDEVHRVGDSDDSRYQVLLHDLRLKNPELKILGLTATPYRLAGGMIYGEEKLFDSVCYSAPIKDLISQGFLSPLRNKSGCDEALPELENIKIRGGDFAQNEVSEAIDKEDLVNAMVKDFLTKAKGRNSIIVFATSIEHANNIWDRLIKMGEVAALLTGITSSPERDLMVQQFKRCETRILVNVSVLTEGFDAPAVDCVVLARPTASRGLYYQMVGRGFRLASGKTDCLVLDYGQNIYRHGPIDVEVEYRDTKTSTTEGKAPVKICPNCKEICHASLPVCPDCNHQFPERTRQECDRQSDEESNIMSDVPTYENRRIYKAEYMTHVKKGAPENAPKTMRAMYHYGVGEMISEWICVEHKGFARRRAEAWWRKRTNEPIPNTAAEAVQIANEFPTPYQVIIQKRKSKDEYDQLIGVVIEPESVVDGSNTEELPF